VGIWEATERSEFFMDSLKAQDFPIDSMESISHPDKKHQWLASRFLLCYLYPAAIQLYRTNKPILYNGPFISFSHSENLVGVIISAAETGIDVQTINPKIRLISSKFLNPEEPGIVNLDNELMSLCMIWSIKEAVFKVYGTELPFKNIKVKNFDPVSDIASVSVERKGQILEHNLATLIFKKATSAYVLD
jgi:phosphopantetheinyl transferase